MLGVFGDSSAAVQHKRKIAYGFQLIGIVEAVGSYDRYSELVAFFGNFRGVLERIVHQLHLDVLDALVREEFVALDIVRFTLVYQLRICVFLYILLSSFIFPLHSVLF